MKAERRRGAKDALQVEAGRFRALVEYSPDVLMLLDETGCIVYVTPSISRHSGWLAEELIGRPALDFLHADDLATMRTQPADDFGSSAVPVPAELRVRQPDGTYRTMEGVAVNRLHDPAVRRIVVNGRDVTDRRRLEQRLRQAEKIQAVERLAGGIAHEFNNLLTAILGYTNLLLEEVPAVAGMRRDLEEIRKAGDRAAALTRQLMSFSRRQRLQPQLIELSSHIARLDERLRELIGNRTELVMRLAPQLPIVNVDPAAIDEIMVNLALNARVALPNGGRLTIETTVVQRDAAEQGADRAGAVGGRVIIAVSDDGEGMDEADRSRLFEPLFTTKGQGTGLCLATVHGLVQQIGGSIQVESEPGVGTAFRISLPAFDPGASGVANSGDIGAELDAKPANESD